MANEDFDLLKTNQAKINGRLCQVDWRLLQALRIVTTALEKMNADVGELKNFIDEADQISATVAEPDPPGCNPRDRTSAPGQ